MIRTFTAVAVLFATTALASGQTLDDQIRDFINAPGFDAIDTMPLELDLSEQWLDTTNVTPGGSVGPMEKAVLIATQAIPSTRTRTALSYGEIIGDDGAPVSLIEVRHYNLGPEIYAETADAYGVENTADIAEFGTGEHMAWRFVFQPLMNNAAVLMDASVRTISNKEAAKSDCFGRPCLDPIAGFDDLPWQEVEGQLPVWPHIYADQSDEVATPAHVVAELAVLGYWASAESGRYEWTGGEHPEAVHDSEPYRFVSIDRNLGQDSGIDAIWRETKLMDDELFAITFRRAEVAGSVYLMRLGEYYPGRP